MSSFSFNPTVPSFVDKNSVLQSFLDYLAGKRTTVCAEKVSHNDLGVPDGLSDGFMRQDASSIDVDFFLDDDVFTQDGVVFQARPLTHARIPTDDARRHPGVRFHLGGGEDKVSIARF